MYIMLLLALGVLRPSAQNTFTVQAELQGLYEEINQATLQFVTDADVDQFHSVLYSSDWVFIDTMGQRHPWAEMRKDALQALTSPPLDWMTSSIQKVSLTSDSATAVVTVTTVRTIVDADGKYGPAGASHSLMEKTPFRDVWVKMADSWKLQSREQIAKTTTSVKTSQYATYLKDYDVGR